MDQMRFDAEINRLAAAYRVEISKATRGAYWLAFHKTPESKFNAACEKAIEHDDSFPSIAALKEILRVRNEANVTTVAGGFLLGESAEDRMMREGRENAARLRHAGILSDQWPSARIVHLPDSPMFGGILQTYEALKAMLERTIDRRDAEFKADPNNTDLARRVGVLVETHSATERRYQHFAATGETI